MFKAEEETFLGFNSSRVGNYSIRNMFSVILYLRDLHPYNIMMQGRWISEGFLSYVIPQVKQCSTRLSTNMVQDYFFTITELYPTYGEQNGTKNTSVLIRPNIIDHVLNYQPSSLDTSHESFLDFSLDPIRDRFEELGIRN